MDEGKPNGMIAISLYIDLERCVCMYVLGLVLFNLLINDFELGTCRIWTKNQKKYKTMNQCSSIYGCKSPFWGIRAQSLSKRELGSNPIMVLSCSELSSWYGSLQPLLAVLLDLQLLARAATSQGCCEPAWGRGKLGAGEGKGWIVMKVDEIRSREWVGLALGPHSFTHSLGSEHKDGWGPQ